MFKIQKSFFVLLLFATALFAEANIHQIYQTMSSGHIDEAHKMIEEVLQKHPESAKAHFVDAEILVRQGNKKAAHDELAIAEQLSPKLPFAKPEAVVALKQMIEGSSVSSSSRVQTSQSTQDHKSSGTPWMTFLLTSGAVFFIVLIWKSFANRRSNGYSNAPAYNGVPQQGSYTNNPNNQGYQGNQGGSSLGSNIMSGLATGAAAGVGMVATEELMHHFTDHNDSSGNNSFVSNDNNSVEPSNDMGDTDFGISDGSSWDNYSSDSDDNSW